MVPFANIRKWARNSEACNSSSRLAFIWQKTQLGIFKSSHFFFCQHQARQGNEVGVEILLNKSKGNGLMIHLFDYKMELVACHNVFQYLETACEEPGLSEE